MLLEASNCGTAKRIRSSDYDGNPRDCSTNPLYEVRGSERREERERRSDEIEIEIEMKGICEQKKVAGNCRVISLFCVFGINLIIIFEKLFICVALDFSLYRKNNNLVILIPTIFDIFVIFPFCGC